MLVLLLTLFQINAYLNYHLLVKNVKNMLNMNLKKTLMKTTSTPAPAPTPTEKQTFYRVRKNWADSKSQIGAYTNLKNAEEAFADIFVSRYRALI